MKKPFHLTPWPIFFLAILLTRPILAEEGHGAVLDFAAWEKVPRPEWPTKAAARVAEAKLAEREIVAKKIIKTSHLMMPKALPTIVSAIATAVPELATVVASAAGKLQPEDGPLFARAAAAAAPQQVGKIVFSLCRDTPSQFANISLAADEASPMHGREIMESVAEALPALRLIINSGLMGAYASSVPVGQLVSALIPYALTRFQLSAAVSGMSPVQALTSTKQLPPSAGPPFKPVLPGTFTITFQRTQVIRDRCGLGGARVYCR